MSTIPQHDVNVNVLKRENPMVFMVGHFAPIFEKKQKTESFWSTRTRTGQHSAIRLLDPGGEPLAHMMRDTSSSFENGQDPFGHQKPIRANTNVFHRCLQ